ncbi:hypothetical protein BJ170DRAFT_590636 [Xylariales sp. AK1849]|nr:hypothetical protein BJ170DRAFT_590636 [Xylariales sp. AK1849]
MCHQRPLHVRCSFCDVFLNEQNPNEDPNDSTQGPLDRVQDGYTHFVRCTKAEKQLARWESVVSEVDAAIEFFKSIGTKAEDILVEFAWELKLKKRTEAKISHWKCPNGMTWDLEPIISLHYCGACFRETSAWDQWPSREAHVKWLESEANARVTSATRINMRTAQVVNNSRAGRPMAACATYWLHNVCARHGRDTSQREYREDCRWYNQRQGL